MKKFIILGAVIISIFSNLTSQNICDFDDNFAGFTQVDWDALENEEVSYQDWVANCNGCVGSATIPTVVHVFHSNPSEIVDESTINAILKKINSDLFGSQGGHKTGIQLELAMVDDYGNCTSGIEYIEVPESLVFSNSNDAEWKPLSIYDTDHYLNIWVCNFTGNASTTNGMLNQFVTTSDFDGITIKRETFLNTLTVGHEFEEAMTHEVGHYFGLYHVWGTNNAGSTCAQGCHTDEQNLTRGDRVGDTNRCYTATPFSNCDPIEQCISCNSDITENYPKENFMSYAKYCKTQFTEGQAIRMWWFLNQFRDLLNTNQNQICSGTTLAKLGHNIEVESNENWTTSNLLNNGKVIITGDLTIKSGAELIIGAGVELHFCTSGRMIIERGATVRSSGRLTNACGDQWQGVTVYGTSNALQGNYFDHPDQGMFYSNSGSKIENAVVGVTCSGPSFTSESGGIFHANGVQFLDNTTAVKIPPYFSFGNYRSSFSDCIFSSDGSFPFSSFIDLTDVKGIKISGSDFTYTGPSYGVGIAGYGYGVWAKSSGILMGSSTITDKWGNPTGVDRCHFSGLGYGVHITNTLGNKSFEIEHAQFDNCFVGIYDGGMSIGKIIYNDFNLGTVPDPALISADDQSQIGLFLQSTLIAMELQENTFSGTGSYPFHITGLIADNIGQHTNKIRKNVFRDCSISNLATRINGKPNAGLLYQCNDFGSRFYDVIVPINDAQGNNLHSRINRQQETVEDGNSLSAGNLFTLTDFPEGNFLNEGPEVTYRYEDGVDREEPFNYSGLQLVDSDPASCNEELCPPPCDNHDPQTPLGDIKEHFIIKKGEKEIALTDLHDGNTTSTEATLLNEQISVATHAMNNDTDDAFAIIAQDSTGGLYTEYLWWIENQDTYESDLWLAGEYAAQNDWAQVHTILNAIPTTYTLQGDELLEWQSINNVFSIIETAGIYNLSSSAISVLTTIANGQNGNASILANNILILIGLGHNPEYYMPDMSNTKNRSDNSSENSDTKIYNISPNPTTGRIFISWDNLTIEMIDITVSDITGKIVLSTSIPNQSDSSLEGNQSGIYIVRIGSKEDAKTYKIIKID